MHDSGALPVGQRFDWWLPARLKYLHLCSSHSSQRTNGQERSAGGALHCGRPQINYRRTHDLANPSAVEAVVQFICILFRHDVALLLPGRLQTPGYRRCPIAQALLQLVLEYSYGHRNE